MRYEYANYAGQLEQVNVGGIVLLRDDNRRIYLTREGKRFAVYYGLSYEAYGDLANALAAYANCAQHSIECDLSAFGGG
jgi:hypothetical protein